MKCPKCGYLGFETVDRCRNCGYEFSLTTAADLPPDSFEHLDIDDLPEVDVTGASVTPATRAETALWPAPRPERPESADVSARLVAVLIDLALFAVVDAVVIYLTMQICGVTWQELGILPKGPLLAFLLVQN